MIGLMETGESLDPLQASIHDVFRQDPLPALLRTHLWAEEGLRRCVAAALPDYHKPEDLKFAAALKLSVAVGVVPKGIRPSYATLNNHRNMVGHRLDSTVTDAMREELVRAVPADFGAWLEEHENELDRTWRACLYHLIMGVHMRANYLEERAPWWLASQDGALRDGPGFPVPPVF